MRQAYTTINAFLIAAVTDDHEPPINIQQQPCSTRVFFDPDLVAGTPGVLNTIRKLVAAVWN